MSHVFLSYSRKQRSYARKLARHLADHGVPVWMDDEIVTGDRWEDAIRTRIDTCAAVVVVMSPDAEASAWVTRELARAESRGKPVYPVLHSGEVFFRLADVHFEDVRGGRLPSGRFTASLREVADAPALAPPVGRHIRLRHIRLRHIRLRHVVPVLVAAALVPVGISATDWLRPDGGDAAPSSERSTTGSTAPTPTTTAPVTSSGHRHDVRVYNNSIVPDLDAVATNDVRALGWTVTESRNHLQGVVVPTSTVYFHPDLGEEPEARELATALRLRAEPRFEGILSEPPGLILIVTRDYPDRG
ncbi:TIR domain-containing protein [Saccharothrix longispora]|uniref:TIR domain-containing protein n=1 Tax=Saccharothrix longispora TaxID=33920 RepID=UPI0028FD03A8|nr:TIR domain-containing protein [Saccharothrix longispora]MDU0289929.1 TIR domain-containing protein [Saccharothrix longispora]